MSLFLIDGLCATPGHNPEFPAFEGEKACQGWQICSRCLWCWHERADCMYRSVVLTQPMSDCGRAAFRPLISKLTYTHSCCCCRLLCVLRFVRCSFRPQCHHRGCFRQCRQCRFFQQLGQLRRYLGTWCQHLQLYHRQQLRPVLRNQHGHTSRGWCCRAPLECWRMQLCTVVRCEPEVYGNSQRGCWPVRRKGCFTQPHAVCASRRVSQPHQVT